MCTIGPVVWWPIVGSRVRRILWDEGVAKAGTKKILSYLQNAPPPRLGFKGDSPEHVCLGGESYNMPRNGRKYLLVTKCEWWAVTAFPPWQVFVLFLCRGSWIYPLVTSAPLPHGWISLGQESQTYCAAAGQHFWSGVGFAFIDTLQLSPSFKNSYAPVLALQWYVLSLIRLRNPISVPPQMWCFHSDFRRLTPLKWMLSCHWH